jgi:hypothetical protein
MKIGGIGQMGLVLVALTFEAVTTNAEVIVFKDGATMPTEDVDQRADYTHMAYGPVRVHYGSQPLKWIELNHPEEKGLFEELLAVGVAEADESGNQAVISAYLQAVKVIRHARRLAAIRPVVTASFYQTLQQKVDEGVYELMILEMLRGLMPTEVSVYTTQVQDGHAKIVASGKGQKIEMLGIVEMSLEEGQWKLAQESWIGNDRLAWEDVNPGELLSLSTDPQGTQPSGVYQWRLADYGFDQNPLGLESTGFTMPKDSFSFLFCVERQAMRREKLRSLASDAPARSPHLHLIWTSSRQIVPKQKVLTEHYPIDISIAHEKEGYMPGTFNLRLPRRQPKQFYVGVMYKF